MPAGARYGVLLVAGNGLLGLLYLLGGFLRLRAEAQVGADQAVYTDTLHLALAELLLSPIPLAYLALAILLVYRRGLVWYVALGAEAVLAVAAGIGFLSSSIVLLSCLFAVAALVLLLLPGARAYYMATDARKGVPPLP
jgi:hypothetical protein